MSFFTAIILIGGFYAMQTKPTQESFRRYIKGEIDEETRQEGLPWIARVVTGHLGTYLINPVFTDYVFFLRADLTMDKRRLAFIGIINNWFCWENKEV